MEWIVYILIAIIAFASGYMCNYLRMTKYDGVIIVNDEQVEVIFKDSYEDLLKKRYVRLENKS